MREKRRRSGRIGLLTDNERQFLKGELELGTKGDWSFRKRLLYRLNSCIDDLGLISKSGRLDGWRAANFVKLHYLTRGIKDVNAGDGFRTIYIGRVKFSTVIRNGRRTRLYWLDKQDTSRTYYEGIFHPEHQVRGIKPDGKRKELLSFLSLSLLPTSSKEALSIDELRQKAVEEQGNETKIISFEELSKQHKEGFIKGLLTRIMESLNDLNRIYRPDIVSICYDMQDQPGYNFYIVIKSIFDHASLVKGIRGRKPRDVLIRAWDEGGMIQFLECDAMPLAEIKAGLDVTETPGKE